MVRRNPLSASPYAAVLTSNGNDQRTEINSAIQNVPLGSKILLKPAQDGGPFVISGGSITVDRAVGLEGVGAWPLYGTQTLDFKTIDIPLTSPFLQGTVIQQQTAATDGIRVTTAGTPVHLADLGVTFASGIRFGNTGNGVVASPPSYASSQDNGATGSRWRNVVVFGHGGNNYGFVIQNLLYGTFEHLHSWGGGALQFNVIAAANGGNSRFYGGSVFTHLYGQVIAGGAAHGLWLRAQTSLTNGILFLRPQVTVQDIGASARAILSSGSAPTSAQKIVKADATTRFFTFLQQDFETNVSSVVDTSSAASVFTDPAGIVFPIGSYFDSFTARYTDTISKIGVPGPVGLKTYTTAGRPSASSAGAGANIYDSDLGKPIWSNATVWKDAAGTTV